jgi:hypothetical protein
LTRAASRLLRPRSRRAATALASRQRGAAAADLLAALVLAVIALAAMVLAVRLESPGPALTAPGLLPLLTGASLLLMAVGLAVRSWRAGAWAALRRGPGRPVSVLGESAPRLWLLAVIGGQILLIGWVDIEIVLPFAFMSLPISGYEVFSVLALILILRKFWRGPWWRCVLIALLAVEVVAIAFRYGFGIPMPAAF